jgi:3-oxoacyl-(acyl-carrier-protein) synthase
MQRALQMAGRAAKDVDHVNAHGTGTALNDVAEAKAIAAVLGIEVPVVSTKGYTGHALGGAGAIEAVLSVLALEEGFVPASLGCDPIDPKVEINVVREPMRLGLRRVLSNSFAFGGNNISVLLRAP